MPYTTVHGKITLSGVLEGTEEIFSTGFRISSPNGLSGLEWANFDRTDALAQIAQLVVDYWSAPTNRVPVAWQFNQVKAAYLDDQGSYLADPVVYEVTPTSGGGGEEWAPQLALVTTLSSGKRKDPGKYSRMYWPTVGVLIDSQGRLTKLQQTNVLNSFALLIESINNVLQTEIGPDVAVYVMSNSNPPFMLPAVEAKVGRVLDTQRRRRNKLVEEYVTTSID